MNEMNIECPSCGCEVPVTAVLQSKLESTVRQEMQAKLADQRKQLIDREAVLQAAQEELKSSNDKLQQRVREAIDAERKKLSEEMLAKARQSVQIELTDRDAELSTLKTRVKESEKMELDLRRRERELKEQAERVHIDVERKLEAERKKLSDEMLAKARESLQLELTGRDQELTELKKRIKESESTELDLRRRERELQEKAERVEIEVERKMETERVKARTEAMKQADERYEMKNAEKEKTIADMRKKIDELRRKSEQSSQQLQGEVQELALEERLRHAFPIDTIDAVGKGRNGADVGQAVCDASGTPAGKIIWESKRTKNWSADWLPKIRDDLRQAGADVAVIVTETLPEGIATFGCIEGVLVCRWDCVIGLATVLRNGLIDLAAAQNAQSGRGTKVEMLYDYFAGNNFRNRISGVVEAFQTLQKDLVKEKAATHRQWAKRERQLDRAVVNMAGLYGDFQGIVGEVVPSLEGFEPLTLEAGESPEEKPADKDAA